MSAVSCAGEFTDGDPGTCTIAVYKPPDDGVWYRAHDACLRAAAHTRAPLKMLNQ